MPAGNEISPESNLISEFNPANNVDSIYRRNWDQMQGIELH